ncbi:SLBB domain-containing protein [Gammaproteobacteria bacterium]|nr:SLBB domain-containing protein [Gammaproteobacteria bacterium]
MKIKKLLVITLIPLALLLSFDAVTQEINPSLLKDLSPAQIEIAKSQLSKSKSIEKPKPAVKESTKRASSVSDINKSSNKKYGYNYFLSTPTTISAVGDLPLPNEYKISLNDQFTIILSGSKEAIFDLNVNLDGSILFPELGSISVVGETFQEVKTKLKNFIEQSYIGVQIDLSLKNLSAKKITIVGAVKTPGTYLVNPFSTISSALGYSGGISEIGTLRNIRLIRTNGKTYSFDLYKLLISGNRSDDITIESGDVIIIDPAQQFINITGQVKRPAIYEVREDETLDDLINFALGYTQTANKSNINLRVLDIQSSSIKSINVSNSESDLSDVLSVNVNTYVNKNIASVSVTGAIKEPGFYPITTNETLEEIINKLEFIDVYPWLGVLEQFDDENLVKSVTLFNLKDPNTYRSVKVLPNSRLFFANINSRKYSELSVLARGLIADYDLRINHKQGTYTLPVFGRFDVKSFVDYLGLDMSDVEDEATYISPLDNIIIKDDYKNMQFITKKYNTVSFRSPVNDLIRVTIKGAVDFPGTYTMNAESVINDLYELVGDFKSEAFLEGIIFTRQSVRNRQRQSIQKSKEDLNKALLASSQKGENIGNISVIRALSQTIEPESLGRIAGDFSPESLSSSKTILLDGDSIIVPRNPNTINVLGEVLNPIAFEYNKRITLRSAIDNSGGYQDYADKRKVYVIKANGLIEKANRNIFTRNVKLEPGDTIVVPRKIITNNPGIEALLPVTQILSDLAFSAAAIESLSNPN